MTNQPKEIQMIDSEVVEEAVEELVGELAKGFRVLANAITPTGAHGNADATGGHVESLTEAVMGMTNALVSIAHAIESLAQAVNDHEA